MRSAMHAASQLPGGGAQIWMILLHLHVNLNADDDDDTQYLLHTCIEFGMMFSNHAGIQKIFSVFLVFYQDHSKSAYILPLKDLFEIIFIAYSSKNYCI